MPKPTIVAAILNFIQTDSWDASAQVLEQQKSILFGEGVDDAFAALIEQAGDNVEDKRIFYTHRSLIHRAKEIGITPAFEELKNIRRQNPRMHLVPVELVPILQQLETASPTRVRAFLQENPDIREQLLDMGILEIRAQPPEQSLDDIILRFINATNWEDKRRILENNPRALNSAAAVVFFEEALRKAVGMDTMVLQAHQRLLTRCQEIGIEAAFAEAQQALDDAKNAGYDMSPPLQ